MGLDFAPKTMEMVAEMEVVGFHLMEEALLQEAGALLQEVAVELQEEVEVASKLIPMATLEVEEIKENLLKNKNVLHYVPKMFVHIDWI